MTRRRLLRSAALIVGGWTLLELTWIAPRLVRHLLWDAPLTPDRVGASLAYGWFWAALTPLVFLVASRFPLAPSTWRRHLPVHAAASLVFFAADRMYVAAADQFFGYLPWPSLEGLSWWERVVGLGFSSFGIVLAIYATLVGIHHALHFHRASRERALRAADLEGELARTRLQVLRMQLQPRFLFETLRGIAARVEADPAGADRMISRLSDFLRLTLERGARAEVSLREELEFLDAYLEVEALRVADAPRVHKRIAPEALDARVPNLILQPLVMTAAAAGRHPRVDLSAQRSNGTLVVEVGNGAAADGAEPRREEDPDESGLAAIGERLRQLYGAEHRLELRGAPGGLQVWLEIPFREDDQTETPR